MKLSRATNPHILVNTQLHRCSPTTLYFPLPQLLPVHDHPHSKAIYMSNRLVLYVLSINRTS
jgi:hypothetical protein